MDSELSDFSATTLIADNDPAPYQVLNPDGKASMLLLCDHASRAFPEKMKLIGLDESALERHIAWDIGAAEITRRLSEKLDAAAVLAGYSRLLIDVNRQPGDPGSIPEVSDTTIVPGNLDLSEEEQLSTGVPSDYVRVSVGTEHIDDIIEDFEQALKASKN